MKGPNYGFKKLDVWKLGMSLVNETYKITEKFPPEEKFSLTSQLRRASISVPLNIAEGSIKRTKKDFGSFVRISLGSLMEVVTCLEIADNQGYLNGNSPVFINNVIQELYFKLISLDKFLTKTSST